jgi:hypothetical protein
MADRKYQLTFPNKGSGNRCPYLMVGNLKIEFGRDPYGTCAECLCGPIKFSVAMESWDYHPSDDAIEEVLYELCRRLTDMQIRAGLALSALEGMFK